MPFRRGKQLQHKAVVNDLTTLEYIDEVSTELANGLEFENKNYSSNYISTFFRILLQLNLRKGT